MTLTRSGECSFHGIWFWVSFHSSDINAISVFAMDGAYCIHCIHNAMVHLNESNGVARVFSGALYGGKIIFFCSDCFYSPFIFVYRKVFFL